MRGQHWCRDTKSLLAMCIAWLGHGARGPVIARRFNGLQSSVFSSSAGGGLIVVGDSALHRVGIACVVRRVWISSCGSS